MTRVRILPLEVTFFFFFFCLSRIRDIGPVRVKDGAKEHLMFLKKYMDFQKMSWFARYSLQQYEID